MFPKFCVKLSLSFFIFVNYVASLTLYPSFPFLVVLVCALCDGEFHQPDVFDVAITIVLTHAHFSKTELQVEFSCL
jgi:hypothetical protein